MSYPLCRDLQEQEQFFDGVFCRSPADVNFSTGQQVRSGHRRNGVRLRTSPYSACVRSGVASSAPSDDVQPGGPSGRRALVRLLAEQPRRRRRCCRPPRPGQQASDDGDWRRRVGLSRHGCRRTGHAVDAGHDGARGDHRVRSCPRSSRLLDACIRAAEAGSRRRKRRSVSSPGSSRCSRPTRDAKVFRRVTPDQRRAVSRIDDRRAAWVAGLVEPARYSDTTALGA